MAHIAIRGGDSNGRQFVESVGYPDEAFLRDLVFNEPRLIPARDIGTKPEAAVVSLREVGLPGAGSSDVVLIDSDGVITVVECKLSTNPEKKRAVIGQVLDYASSLSGMSYDDLNERCRKDHQGSLNELMQEKVPPEEWNEEQFLASVTGTLSAGTFKLVIATDVMDSDLERILHYISSHSGGSLKIFGLEMRYHKQDDIEAIIPHIANPVSVVERSVSSSWRHWDPEQFRSELDRLDDVSVRDAASDLLEFAIKNAADRYWGRSQDYGSSGYGIRRPDGRIMSLITCYTSGTFYLNGHVPSGGVRVRHPVDHV